MGLLVDGVWHDTWYETEKNQGRFVREQATFRNWITPQGEPGPNGEAAVPAEQKRYHLYVSLACPWANRALIVRKLKGLEDLISVSVVHWLMRENGWTFQAGQGVIADPVMNARYLHQLYTRACPGMTGRVTVPVLWDLKENQIVNNESSEIIRIFNHAFDDLGAKPGNYYPEALRAEIDAVNERIYPNVNNGVYRCGFASTQEAYEEAFYPLFETLDWLEDRLSKQEWLVGNQLTEADIRLFTTLIRFDAVYFGHFKCNKKHIRDYPALHNYVHKLMQKPEFAETIDIFHIKHHYYESHTFINPTGVVPAGPDILY